MSDKKVLLQDSDADEGEDVFYTPPQSKRELTWDNIGGLLSLSPASQRGRERLDSAIPQDYPSSIGQTFGASTSSSSIQQTEPSVRPKIRQSLYRKRTDSAIPQDYPSYSRQSLGASTSSASLQQTEPSVRPRPRPGLSLDIPSRYPPPPEHVRTPTPEIVRELRDPFFSRPDWQHMRRTAEPLSFETPEAKGYELAARSRQEMKRIYRWPHTKKHRKQKLLFKRAFQHNKGSDRWSLPSSASDSEDSDSERRYLIPSRERDESELCNPRYFQPVRQMDHRPHSEIMPIGRIGFGRLDPHYRSKYHSLDDVRIRLNEQEFIDDDPSQWKPKEQAFSMRLRSLSEDDLNAYKKYRDHADPYYHSIARSRMSPAPTDANLTDFNKKFVGRLRRQTTGAGTHQQRRASVGSRASLPSTLYDDDDDDEKLILTRFDEERAKSEEPQQFQQFPQKEKKKKKKKRFDKKKCFIQ